MTSVRRTAATALLLLLAGCGGQTAPSGGPAAEPAVEEQVELLTPPPGVRLTGDGVELTSGLLPFGEPYDAVVDRLVGELGTPSLDTGETSSSGPYGACPGSRLRALEFGGGDLVLLFGDAIGPDLTLYAWQLRGDGPVPPASALVGDTATLEFRVGTTLAELRAGSATETLEVLPGDELLEPGFRLQDQSAGFTGTLTGTSDADAVTSVQAGEACGE